MPKNDIGGFFVSLGLALDKASFETGNRYIDGVTNGLNKLIGTARNAAVVLTGTAVASGVIESSAYKTSVALGVTTEALDLWKASAKIAGVDANGVVTAMTQIANVQNRLKWDDSGIEGFSKKLGKLKISYEEIKDLSSDKALEYILTKAQKLEGGDMNTAEIATAVGDIVGGGGRDLYIELQRQGTSISDFLAGAMKTVFTDSGSNAKAVDFSKEVGTLKTELESISKLLGSEVGGELTPYLAAVNQFIQDHGSDIKDGIKSIADFTGKIAGKVGSFAKWLFQDSSEGHNEFVKALGSTAPIQAMLTGEFDPATMYELLADGATEDEKATYKNQLAIAQKIYNAKRKNWLHKDTLEANEITDDVAQAIREYMDLGGKLSSLSPDIAATKLLGSKYGIHEKETNYGTWWSNEIQDGIMRPDGTVTKVAPDDWVIAARSLGDLARAFTPQNYTAASSNEYVINQTFNISGGNDMPQVLRQQAYRGTQEGLLEIMNQSSQRLQLMSGTR